MKTFVDIDIRTLKHHIFDHELEQWNMITTYQYIFTFITFTIHSIVLVNNLLIV